MIEAFETARVPRLCEEGAVHPNASPHGRCAEHEAQSCSVRKEKLPTMQVTKSSSNVCGWNKARIKVQL
jgi:hypothetical protein